MFSMCVFVCVHILPIRVSSYYKTSTGDRDLMNGVNLRLTAGERVGLVGPNGAVLRTHIVVLNGAEDTYVVVLTPTHE